MATEQNMASAAEWEDIPAEKFEIIAPFCPTKATFSPGRMVRFKFFSTGVCVSGYVKVMLRNSMDGAWEISGD